MNMIVILILSGIYHVFQKVALPTNAAFASKIQGHVGTQQDLWMDQPLEPLGSFLCKTCGDKLLRWSLE